MSADELRGVLARAELRLVMTAHPTEARRRTTIDKLARVFAVLRELDEVMTADEADARRRLLATIQELWTSDDLRAISLTVLDEVRGALVHFSSTLAETVPRIYRDLEDAVAEEPYRRALTFVRERIRATQHRAPGGYAEPVELLGDLRRVEACLLEGPGVLTAAGDLHDVIRQVEVFGFHFARLDIREHAKVHRHSLGEIFATLGVCDGYEQLSDDERGTILRRHIADRRPLVPADISGFSDATQETLQTFRMLRETLAVSHRGAIETYIVSGTERAVDLLEVLLLMKESSLAAAGGGGARLRIVPLFEAGATLESAPETMAALLAVPEYREALRAVGDEQEIMIGYSDSNKDVGYLASGWAAYRAQARIAEVLREHDVRWVFFHGRGGAVGRGGGPTSTAILALPAGTVQGRLKMTEQGEVLAAKYAVGPIAHRELELSLGATLRSAAGPDAGRREQYEGVLRDMARESESMYRRVVHDNPDFVAFFEAVTPCTRSRACGSARAPRGAAARRGLRICGRFRGSSPGRSRGSCCPPGWVSAPRWPGPASVTGSSCCERWRPRGRSSPPCCPTPRWAARRPTWRSRGVTQSCGQTHAVSRSSTRWRPSWNARSSSCWRFWTRAGCWIAIPFCRPRSTGETRSWTRSRSCRSSYCGGCANILRSFPRSWGA